MLTRLNKKNLNFNFAEDICIYYSDPLLLLACKLFFLSNMSTLQDKYVHLQDNYVNLQHYYSDMQENCQHATYLCLHASCICWHATYIYIILNRLQFSCMSTYMVRFLNVQPATHFPLKIRVPIIVYLTMCFIGQKTNNVLNFNTDNILY